MLKVQQQKKFGFLKTWSFNELMPEYTLPTVANKTVTIPNLMGSDGIQTHLPKQISRFGTTLAGWRFSL